jgi:hypothetical protein
MRTALSAASFFNLCKRRANDRPIVSIVNIGFAEKSRLNTVKPASNGGQHANTMMSGKNREIRKTRKGAHT